MSSGPIVPAVQRVPIGPPKDARTFTDVPTCPVCGNGFILLWLHETRAPGRVRRYPVLNPKFIASRLINGLIVHVECEQEALRQYEDGAL